MAILDTTVTPSITFEEVLADGSTVTTPAADTRRLFLGEDGLFHMKDSAGAITDVGAPATPPAAVPAFPLDNVTLDATFGDHFLTPTLDAKWVPLGRVAGSQVIENSHLIPHPLANAHYGDMQNITDADEIDVTMAASYFGKETDEGFGLAVLNSSNTGLWLGFRASSRLGLFAVTAGVTGTEPVANMGIGGAQWLGYGRKSWYKLSKRRTLGVDLYYWGVSFDGVTWYPYHQAYGYDPTDFTPAKFGWMVGVQNAAGLDRLVAIDWVNATRRTLSANRLMTPTSGTVTVTHNATGASGTGTSVINGSIGDEWYFPSSNPADTYWDAAWSVAQSINRVRIRTRGDAFGSGRVTMSGGVVIPWYSVGAMWSLIDLPAAVSTTSLRVYWHKQGYGANPGFMEIEAYLAS